MVTLNTLIIIGLPLIGLMMFAENSKLRIIMGTCFVLLSILWGGYLTGCHFDHLGLFLKNQSYFHEMEAKAVFYYQDMVFYLKQEKVLVNQDVILNLELMKYRDYSFIKQGHIFYRNYFFEIDYRKHKVLCYYRIYKEEPNKNFLDKYFDSLFKSTDNFFYDNYKK